MKEVSAEEIVNKEMGVVSYPGLNYQPFVLTLDGVLLRLGMVSYKMLITTFFGHKNYQYFTKCDIFLKKSTALDNGLYWEFQI